ncbi:hypothetical protein [Thiohalomonas denitrificans]|uniref:Uncharacterized protein n=1 Tax=Thiohalomonas denitrificans TaxID=415747 RepID=A0A1G5Q060_9GAMM|nr:hypothetical protein [Thiohalomonas denitrificans]SCZ55234.1 hypothetical protein SAMN03097708_01093 [Thiohalomonas denitrificans]
MEETQRTFWSRAMQASLSEFISRPSDASQSELEKLLNEYREAVDKGEVVLYKPRAA